ncbi:Phospholipase D1 [Geodia barretti]|uniref:phospholipase D n=1 Tax=Geodia barretti TaxID=519541 RepID=A0AA35SL35_GEOBA|nr:Phospholipase D1 [Geodia barretti]
MTIMTWMKMKGILILVILFKIPSANNLRIQVLRSVDRWSADENHEASIYNAYLHAIENAQHSIYIENQFFISSQSGVFLKVENQLLSAMAKRIARAYRNGEDFHIYVIMPLKPEFPGEWDTKSGKDLSKLMIVDDKITIIGSANINDRSMLGSRDSEVAVMIEDVQVMDGRMKGHSFPVGKFSHSLRCHLMREHLGLLDDESYNMSTNLKVEDPLELHPRFGEVALANTLTFERVFGGRITPTDHVWNFDDLKNRVSIPGLVDFDVNEAKKELSNIRGNIVIYPLLFLAEVLKPSYLDMFSMYVDTRGDTKDLNFDTEKTFVA